MKYRFNELVDIKKLQKLTDNLFSVTGIPTSIKTLDGEILTQSGWRKICSDFHRNHPEIKKECLESDIQSQHKLKAGESFAIHRCPMGFVKAFTPIIIEHEHIASLFSGLIFLEHPDSATEAFFRDQAREYGFDENKYLQAFNEIPVFTEDKFHSSLFFLVCLADMIADMGFSRIRELKTSEAYEESKEKLRSITEMSGEYLWQLGFDGKFSFVSSTAKNIFGYEREEVIGMDYRAIFPESEKETAAKVFSKAIAGDPYQLFELQAARKDGSIFPVEISASPVMKSGNIVGVQGIIRDITGKKQSEKALREERDLIERIMETSPAGIVRVDADGQMAYANKRAEEILGIKISEIPGRKYDDPLWQTTDFDGNPIPRESLPFSIVKRTKQSLSDIRHAIRWPDDRKVLLSINAAPLMDANGAFEGMVATLDDITDKIETEKNYQMLFQEMIDGFALHEIIRNEEGRPVDYRFLAINPAFERLTGLKSETTVGKTVLEVLPNTEPYWIERYGLVALTGEPVEFENYARELERYFHVTAFSPKKDHFACIFEDVTRRKTAEDALKESEARFRSFMDNFPDHAFIKDKQSRYIYGNRAIIDFWKTTPEKWAGSTAHDYLSEKVARNIDHRDRIILEKRRVVDEDIIIKNPSGEKEYRREIRFPLEMPNGQLFVGGLSIDISELMLGKEERHRLVAAIEQTGESLVITSPNGTIEYANPAFETITGYSREEIIGKNPRILKSGYHDASVYKTLWNSILSGKRWTGRLTNRRKDGTNYTSECTITPVKNDRDEILNFVWIARDVSGEIALENRMAQAQKMESIGNLAGGIAHDFNNILFPILGLAEMLLEDLPTGSLERENVEEIYRAGKRGSDLVKQILSFGRRSDQKKLPIRIQSVLGEVLTLARATIPANIEIKQVIQKKCGRVMADPTQLHQIAMNLITNALHAVEETGGEISVGLRETEVTSDNMLTHSICSGKYAVLTVSDTGCGMEPAVLEKIFEPYFTTKGQGKGTGLGLAVVYGIVREHQGEIRVESKIGIGTAIDVFLPLIAEISEGLTVKDDTDIPGGNERILLVDDEEPIVRLGRHILERLGYRVTTHTFGIDALNAFRADPEGFDLVITDMTMPVITGEKLVREIVSIRPDMPAIICTGYNEQINQKKAEAAGAKGLLMKPISRSDMGREVRCVLDSVKKNRKSIMKKGERRWPTC